MKKRVTLQEIAERAGTSGVAAGRVLLGSGAQSVRVSEATANLIRTVAKELNYQPNQIAQQLAGKRSKLIGAIIDSNMPEVHRNIFSKMEAIASKKGYRFIIGQAHDSPKRLLEYIYDFQSRGVDAFISLSHDYPFEAEELIKAIGAFKNSLFVLPPCINADKVNYVGVDFYEGIHQAVKHLIEKNRRKISLLLYSSGSMSMVSRAEAYKKAIKQLGISKSSDLICYMDTEKAGDNQYLRSLLEKIIKDHHTDAIVCVNDSIAARAIRVLKDMELSVPDDISIIGNDNLYWTGFMTPSITSIDQKPDELAEVAMKSIFQMIEGENIVKPFNFKVKPELIIRESS